MKIFDSQKHLYNYIDRKTKDSLPRSILLLGESGCGKHSLVTYIGEKFNFPVIDISDKLGFEFIMSLYEKPEPYLYIIEASKITIKEQNMILKFIEEPLKNSYIIILAENSNQLLLTIYNRCQVLKFNPFSTEELKEFTSDELILKIAKTPGQISKLIATNSSELVTFCDKIVNKIGTANLPNVLTIPDKIAFKNEKDKFDLECFSRTLNYLLVEKIKQTNSDVRYQDMYKLVSEWNVKRKAPTIVQNVLLENYLVKMHLLMR